MKNVHPEVLPRTLKLVLRALLLAWTALGLFGCKPEAKPVDKPAPKIAGDRIVFATNAPQLSYLTIEPAQSRGAAATGLYGRLAWADDVTVRVYSPVAGRVVKIPAELNEEVTSGDALALLDSPDFGQALSDARTAAGNFTAAEKAFARARELLAHGAAAQKDVEAAEAAFVSAHAEKDRSAGRLANYGGSAQSSNQVYVLRAPVGGMVVEKNINPGQEIRSDLMLANAPQFTNPQFVITDPTRMWLFLDVDELSVTALTPGREVSLRSRAYPEKVFSGRLESIGHELDPTTRTIKARCLVDNRDRLLRAEMYVTAEVASDGAAMVDVPTKAIFLKENQHYVFVESAPGQFERRSVKLGAEDNGRTAVLGGIETGQRVVTEGCLLLESMVEGDNS